MNALYFRWNDDTEKLRKADAYFIPGGFSYEDRGRAGMVAARDPVLQALKQEATKGKVIVGVCNGAQVLIESGLIPLNDGLNMSLARNVVEVEGESVATGFLNEWVWITPSCAKDRCAVSNWDVTMHIPIAHGEGRFTTKDKGVIEELKRNNQIVFSYCDEDGNISESIEVTPNGSMYAIAGICNPEGNVIALMPHPERTRNGDPFFTSMREWIVNHKAEPVHLQSHESVPVSVPTKSAQNPVEIFIDTLIVNNEERTVEQAAHRTIPSLKLRQLKYISIPEDNPMEVLNTIAIFNPNKEIAFLRRGDTVTKWDADAKKEEVVSSPLTDGIALLRRDDPDTGAASLKKGSETGVCYICSGASEEELMRSDTLEIFSNPHASALEQLV